MRDLAIGIAIILGLFIGFTTVINESTKKDIEHVETTPVVERLSEDIFVNEDNKTANGYRISFDQGIVDVYYNNEHYTAVYRNDNDNDDTINWTTPTGETINAQFSNYTTKEDLEKTNVFNVFPKFFNHELVFDPDVTVTLSTGKEKITLIKK